MQSPDPQDSAEYEAWIRQRSDRQRSSSLTSTSRFLRRSTSTKRSMCQRCYKEKFQQPKPCTENSGDASSAVYLQHFCEQAEASAAHRHSTCEATQIPMIQKMQKMVEILQSSVRRPPWLKSLRSCRTKTSAKDPAGTETRGSSQTELWTFQSC